MPRANREGMENTNQANNQQNNSNKRDRKEEDEHRKEHMKGLRPDDDLETNVDPEKEDQPR